MKINAQPVRGTKDFLPNEAELRDYVQGKIADTYKQYGFQKSERRRWRISSA